MRIGLGVEVLVPLAFEALSDGQVRAAVERLVAALGFMVQDIGFGVRELGSRVFDLGLRV